MKPSDKQTTKFTGHSLYHFSSCPFCLTVRFYMWRKGIRLPLRDIHKDSKHAHDLREGGGKTQVPCLLIEGPNGSSRFLYESADIIRYLQDAKMKPAADSV